MPMYIIPNKKRNIQERFKDPAIYNRVSNIHKSPTPDIVFKNHSENAIEIPDVTEFLNELELTPRPQNEPQKENNQAPFVHNITNMSPYRTPSIKYEPQIPRYYFNKPDEKKDIEQTFWDPTFNSKLVQPQIIQEKKLSPYGNQLVPQVIQYNDDPELCECHGCQPRLDCECNACHKPNRPCFCEICTKRKMFNNKHLLGFHYKPQGKLSRDNVSLRKFHENSRGNCQCDDCEEKRNLRSFNEKNKFQPNRIYWSVPVNSKEDTTS